MPTCGAVHAGQLRAAPDVETVLRPRVSVEVSDGSSSGGETGRAAPAVDCAVYPLLSPVDTSSDGECE